MTNEFKKYHPAVNFIYFTAVIGFSMFVLHPVCLGISLSGALLYMYMLRGGKAFAKGIVFMIPAMLAAALINPAFNHEGITVLMYLPGGNPLTAESIAYGFAAACMLAGTVCWFVCFNEIITSDKIIYLFGRIFPSLSLILSMTFRLVPQFATELKKVSDAQKCIGRDITQGSAVARAKHGLSVLSVMITRAFEKSVETADSMKSRGYGLKGRTAFSLFRFSRRDLQVLIFIVLCASYIMAGIISGGIAFRYYPSLKGAETDMYTISIFAVYAMLVVMPIAIEIREVIRWNVIKSKI